MFVKNCIPCLTFIFLSYFCSPVNSNLGEHPQYLNGKFEATYTAVVQDRSPKIYEYSYNFYHNQTWAIYVCISSFNAMDDAPLRVVVRESLYAIAWSVPVEFEVKSSKHPEICHTLCPLDDFIDINVPEGVQKFYVDVSTSSLTAVSYELTVSNFTNFVIQTKDPITVNVTTTSPKVLEYHIPEDYKTARIEVSSPSESCMIVSIQDIRCPFHDIESSVENKGFSQTMTKQSAITINERFFIDNKVYIVMVLKAKYKSCLKAPGLSSEILNSSTMITKEVTITVSPSISGEEFNVAVWMILGIYLGFYGFFLYLYNCCCYCYFWKNSEIGPKDGRNMENSNEISVDENKKPVKYLSDISWNYNEIKKKNGLYIGNSLIIAFIYGLPVIQLVINKQLTINYTGKQDLCYYNFMCSYPVWIFSDFNHMYSNIGYIILGILFLNLTYNRVNASKKLGSRFQNRGVPFLYGLYYAMGSALCMEGVLSACYHICPSKSNFQFDTAFMYVICILCILKIYESRHPHRMIHSHEMWTFLTVLYYLNSFNTLIKEKTSEIIFRSFSYLAYLLFLGYFGYKNNPFRERYLVRRPDEIDSLYEERKKPFNLAYKVRIVFSTIACLFNIVFCIATVILTDDIDFATCILYLGIINLLLYIFYYIIVKAFHRESVLGPVLYLIVAFVFWGFAIKYFLRKKAKWEETPAVSREYNAPCDSGLNFYDDHDIWHFLSSFALFFTFMTIFSLDVDRRKKHHTLLALF